LKKKVLVVTDHDKWAFARIFKGLYKYITKYDIFQYNLFSGKTINFHEYDAIIWLCDYVPQKLTEKNIDPNKVIFCIRSMVTHPFFSDTNCFKNLAKVLLVCNKFLQEQFVNHNIKTLLAPGGVDIDIFRFEKKSIHRPILLGWSGSRDNFGREYRGIDFIEEYCEKDRSVTFNPAYREDKWRDNDEMVKYYHSIDIYMDLSQGAGRQNGLLEASACGVPIISTPVGIAPMLINPGINGYIVDRKEIEIKDAILSISSNYDSFQEKASTYVREYGWSWKDQAKLFEKAMDYIIINKE
jgi:glycosyltransferase involved in cell wall biosynthesis